MLVKGAPIEGNPTRDIYLIRCGLVTPYGVIFLGQYWCRYQYETMLFIVECTLKDTAIKNSAYHSFMTLRKTFNEIHTFRVTNMQSKMSSAKCHPFCSGNILIKVMDNYAYMKIGVKIIQVMCFVFTLIAAWIIPTHSARPIVSSKDWLFFHVLLLYCLFLGLLNLRSLISELRTIWFGINKNRSF